MHKNQTKCWYFSVMLVLITVVSLLLSAYKAGQSTLAYTPQCNTALDYKGIIYKKVPQYLLHKASIHVFFLHKKTSLPSKENFHSLAAVLHKKSATNQPVSTNNSIADQNNCSTINQYTYPNSSPADTEKPC